MIRNFIRVCWLSLVLYLIVVGLSYANFWFRKPRLVQNILEAQNMRIWLKNYWMMIMVIILMILVFPIVVIKQRKQIFRRYKYLNHRFMFLLIILTSFIFLHSLISLYRIKGIAHDNLQQFKLGDGISNQVEGEYPWIGNNYYKKSSYYQQTLQKISINRKDQREVSILQDTVKDLHDGKHSLSSFFKNHIMFIDMLFLIYRSAGLVLLLIIIFMAAGVLYFNNKCSICNFVMLFFVIWMITVIFFIICSAIHYVHTLNSHPVCLNKAHSGTFNIIIDKRAFNYIVFTNSLTKNQDPHNIYTTLCLSFQKYYRICTDKVEQSLIIHVTGMVWIGSFLNILLIFGYLIPKYREKFHNYIIGIGNQDQSGFQYESIQSYQ